MEENKNVNEVNAEVSTEAAETVSEETKKKKTSKKQSEADALREELEALKAELAEKDDRHLRMAAEYDNFRRRSREERSAAYDVALSETVSEFLAVVDNLERATLYDDAAKIKEGLVMISRSVEEMFSKLGVEAVGKVGEKFDPNLHNAVMHVDDDSFGEGEIVEVFQKGYKKGSKIIRFAMVKTAN